MRQLEMELKQERSLTETMVADMVSISFLSPVLWLVYPRAVFTDVASENVVYYTTLVCLLSVPVVQCY